MLRASSARSGELSSSARGTGSSQPPVASASSEVQARAQHVERAGAEHLADAEAAPDARELGGAACEVVARGRRGPRR